jgi:glycosyltransferase involved in cell wall biosynthesis
MIVGIDASNLRGGGGVTHLLNVLAAAQPAAHGIERIVVWGGRPLLDTLPVFPWLEKRREAALEGALPRRVRWQIQDLPRRARASCDVLFAPGGSAPHSFSPLVTMSQNLLPFDPPELRRYGLSPIGLRLRLLRQVQARTFRRADGVIFLTQHAREIVTRVVGGCRQTAVVPHGLEDRFRLPPRPPRPLRALRAEAPLRLLYVSIVDVYKHQPVVAEAVARLRREGVPLCVDFVGPAYPPALRLLESALRRLDPRGEFLRYRGPVAYSELHELYHAAELFVFASSCENLPNILLEAMAAGLPIASSDRGPMPEVLGGTGELFDPERVDSVADALRRLARDPELRRVRSEAAFARARDFTWSRCAADTLAFVTSVGAAATLQDVALRGEPGGSAREPQAGSGLS